MHPSCPQSLSRILLPALLSLAAATAIARSPPPAPDCADARQMQEVRQPAAQRIVVATTDGARYRIRLGANCPGLTRQADTALLAREGWVCGLGDEFVRAGGQLCPITAVERISAADYAAEARASLRTPEGATVLEPVIVRGEVRRRFAGSPNYCLNPRWMRGWSEDRDGLRVEMRSRRSGGHRFYRVELGTPCPELINAPSIRLLSGPNIGMVCGNTGDRVLVQTDAFRAFDPTGIEREAFLPTGTDRTQALSARHGCPIVAVYPIP